MTEINTDKTTNHAIKKSIVHLKDISKKFDKNIVLRNLQIDLHPGHLYTLIGKNGAGKSTLMRIIARQENPTLGEGHILGHNIHEDHSLYGIGYLSEDYDIQSVKNIQQFYKTLSALYPQWSQQIFDTILSDLNIDQKKNYRSLSRGQKMQVAFAAVMASQQPLVIADEITAVFDSEVRDYVMKKLKAFTTNGGTVLLSTNIVTEAAPYADHVFLLENGKIVLDQNIKDYSEGQRASLFSENHTNT
jgi:ABC-2 type transport system ATP-binding protein